MPAVGRETCRTQCTGQMTRRFADPRRTRLNTHWTGEEAAPGGQRVGSLTHRASHSG